MTTRATRSLALLAVAALSWSGSAASVGPQRAGAPADAGMQFLEARVAGDPEDFVARNRLAGRYLTAARETGDHEYLLRAEAQARASLAAIPEQQNPGALCALAASQLALHRFADSLSSARRALEIEPGNATALASVGDAELELGNYDEAARIFDRLASAGHSTAAAARRARLAELRGDDAKALELLTAADDSSDWFRLRRGRIHLRAGRLDLAEAEYAAAADSNTRLEHIAELRAVQGRSEEAIAAYRELIARTGRPEDMHVLGDLYRFLGREADAKQWLDRAAAGYLASVEAGQVHYLHHLASLHSDSLPEPARAVAWARRDLELRSSADAYDALAWALYRNGEDAAAKDAISKALKLGGQGAHLFEHAGLIYWRAGDPERGRNFLDRAAAGGPRDGRFHLHR